MPVSARSGEYRALGGRPEMLLIHETSLNGIVQH